MAVVGDEIVLASVRDRVNQAQLEGREVSADNECGLIESILFEKLLLHNARLDSLEVTDAEVMGEIDRRLTYYLQMFGSLEAFEAEYGKTVAEWKAEFQDPVRGADFGPKNAGQHRPKRALHPGRGPGLLRRHSRRQPAPHPRRTQLQRTGDAT